MRMTYMLVLYIWSHSSLASLQAILNSGCFFKLSVRSFLAFTPPWMAPGFTQRERLCMNLAPPDSRTFFSILFTYWTLTTMTLFLLLEITTHALGLCVSGFPCLECSSIHQIPEWLTESPLCSDVTFSLRPSLILLFIAISSYPHNLTPLILLNFLWSIFFPLASLLSNMYVLIYYVYLENPPFHNKDVSSLRAGSCTCFIRCKSQRSGIVPGIWEVLKKCLLNEWIHRKNLHFNTKVERGKLEVSSRKIN